MTDIIITGLIVICPLLIVVTAGLRHRKRIRQQQSYGTVKKVYRGVYLFVWCILWIQVLGWVLFYSPAGADVLVSLAWLIGACVLVALPCELYLLVCRRGQDSE